MAKGSRVTRVQKNTATLNAIRKAMPENTQALVVDVLTDMAENFSQLAARDTSAMAETTYVQLQDGAYLEGKPTTVTAIETIAKSLNPDAEISPSPIPTNKTTGYVKPIVVYYQWYEHGSDKMAGRHTMATARAIAQRNLKSKHMAAINKVVTDGRK